MIRDTLSYLPGLTAGDVVRIERKRQGRSLRSVARDAGVSAPHLSDLERNRKLGSAELIERIARVLSLDAWELCLRDGRIPERVEMWCKTHPAEAARRLREMTKEGL